MAWDQDHPSEMLRISCDKVNGQNESVAVCMADIRQILSGAKLPGIAEDIARAFRVRGRKGR